MNGSTLPGFISRSDDVPDLMPVSRERGPAATLVPTGMDRLPAWAPTSPGTKKATRRWPSIAKPT